MVKKALIIAAGYGSRLNRCETDIPKTLRTVAGLPLLKRILLTAKKAGITEFVIVVGYQKERIIDAVRSYNIGMSVEFVENPDWKKSNGVSVLAAEKVIDENFILLMSDHIFEAKTLENLRQTPLKKHDVLLAVDYKLDLIFDMDDATKVKVDWGFIESIDKNLSDYNAIDTGMFLASPALFEALREVSKNGNCSLSDGVRQLAAKKRAGTFDIKEAFWQDVDTTPALKHAEQILLEDCRKETDGFVSRHLNRRLSLFLTKFLIRTRVSAHHMTGVTTLIGIASGIFMAQGNYWNIVLGAFLFQIASILDGVDGEMSRIKFTASKIGQWLDTISDNLSYLSFVIGLVIGTFQTGSSLTQLIGILTLVGLGLTTLVMFTYLLRFTNSGSMLAIQKDFQKPSPKEGILKKFLRGIQFMIKRDFFALLFFALALIGQPLVILWLCLLGTNILWIVLLNSRFSLIKVISLNKGVTDSSTS